MGGKGLRRRERNYKAAHGSYNRLPPPPDTSQVDTLPSKLRKLMSFTSPRPQESEKVSEDIQRKRKRDSGNTDKKSHPKDALGRSDVKSKGSGGNSKMHQETGSDDDGQSKSSEKKNKKQKRKQVMDLRFEDTLEVSSRRLKKREHRKKYLAKKNKHKKGKTEGEEDLDFPGHEKIEFGDVVEAPLKLLAVPKAFKSAQVAFQERKRLQAISEYRSRKGWASRPGVQIPSMTISPAV